MTFKTLMISAATAAMVAGGAFAESHSTATETEAETTQEMQTETSNDTTSTDAGMSGEADSAAEAESEMETSEAGMTESTATADTSLDAVSEPGAVELAPELMEMTVGDVLGLNVVGPEDETIGEIDYLISGSDGPEAVIGIGGFLGLGEYTVALPLAEFDYDAENERLVLGIDREALEERPEFDESGVTGLPEDMPIAELLPMENMGSASQMNMDTTGTMATGGGSSMGASGDASVETGSDAGLAEGATSETETEMDAEAEVEAEAEAETEAESEVDAEAEAETENN